MLADRWTERSLGELITLEYGAGLPQAVRTGEGYPVYGSSGLVGRHSDYLTQGPGVIVGRKGTVGAVVWSGEAFWPIDTTYYVEPRGDTDLRWIYWCLSGLPLNKLDSSTGVPGLNRHDAYALQVLVPPLPEQRCIAEILDAAEEAIRQTERVIAKLEAVKAGLLHDLLTYGLDEHGRLRDPQAHPEQFKDSPLGRIPREWEISSVESEFEVVTGFTLGPHRHPRKNRKPYLRVANVLREEVLLDDIAELEASYDEMVGRVLQEDDLLVVEGHANPNEIGRCARVPIEAEGLTFQNHLFRLRSKHLDTRFALAWLNSYWVRDHWRRMCRTSSGLNTINSTMLRNLPVPIPGGQEQHCIAAILDTHDARIRAEKAGLAKLRQAKRGLMDDLLTGRVRVSA
jgi:type I restriction enzyme S subunit